jgi:hypothetical protein
MTKELPAKPQTLADSDISSQRVVSRRSLLASLGLGLGIAAAAVVGRPAGVTAQMPGGCTDSDGGPNADPPGMGRRCRGRPTGCTDTDRGPNEDPPGYGRGCWI